MDDYNDNAQSGKGRQTLMLLLLLVLLGGFGYLYFFTSIIRPQEPPAETQPAPQAAAKMPLPARDGSQPAQMTPGAAPVTPPTAGPAPAPVPAAKPQTASAPAPPAATPVAKKVEPKPAPQPAVAPPEKKAAVALKPEEKKVVAPAAKPAAAPAAKPAVAAKPPVAAPTVAEEKKPVAATAAAGKKAVKVKTADSNKATMQGKASGPWTLVVGNYVVEEALVEDIAKVKAAGLNPGITTGQRKATSMNRLYFAEFGDKQAALEAVETMRKLAASPFSIQKGGKHLVFAGSFSMASRAESERQRLAASGMKVTVQKVQATLPSKKLTAGTFTDRKAAEAALKKLKAAGVGAPVLD
jgi:SPOR domain